MVRLVSLLLERVYRLTPLQEAGAFTGKALQLYLFSKGVCCANKRFYALMNKYLLGEVTEQESVILNSFWKRTPSCGRRLTIP